MLDLVQISWYWFDMLDLDQIGWDWFRYDLLVCTIF
jgi:hypothetical protein